MAGLERLSGWGRYPVAECAVHRPADIPAVARAAAQAGALIARGNGRSYGDASINPQGTLVMAGVDRLIDFDPATGQLVCEGGTLLSDLNTIFIPRGWFVPVTPGTSLVTVGGMIASDVHGKNHHGAGSFCDHVAWVDLAMGDGTIRRCSQAENADLFAATCGGMGLTGVIVRACFTMIRIETSQVRQRTIRAANLAHAFETFESTLDWTYSVAWIDCMARGRQLGRSVVLLGEHARADELDAAARATPLALKPRKTKAVPIDFPHFALSGFNVRLFNMVYYAAHHDGDALVDLISYFYPLDAIYEWNRIYGARGFVQYQSVLPLAESRKGIERMLEEISGAGAGSFLAVLKRMGPESFGLMSFPMEGYTLALDFPATPANLALLDRLDKITLEAGGRVYLTKDARVAPATLAAGYPRMADFRDVRRRHGLDRRFSSLLSQRLDL